MTTMTLAVPEELKHKMDSFAEINWSEVARQAFLQKISDMEFLRKFKSKSSITAKGAQELGADLSRKLAKRYTS